MAFGASEADFHRVLPLRFKLNSSDGRLGRLVSAIEQTAYSSLLGLRAVAADFKPDLILRDFADRGAHLLSAETGVPAVDVGCTAGSTLILPITKGSNTNLPGSKEYWLSGLRESVGLPPIVTKDDESPYAHLCYRPRYFYGSDEALLASAMFVRHVNERSRVEEAEAIIASVNRSRPVVMAAVGTLMASDHPDLVEYVIRELSGVPFTVLLLGSGIRGYGGAGNIIVLEDGPQHELLRHVDAVVCHGGLNTVVEALAEGVPLVVVPEYDEARYNAERCVALSAGLSVSAGDLQGSGDTLLDAVMQALEDEHYRKGALGFRAANERSPLIEQVAQELIDAAATW